MGKLVRSLFLIVLMVLQTSCQTLKLEGEVNKQDNLELSIPDDMLNLRFINGYQQIKQQHYYYESSRWIDKNKSRDFFVTYTYLLGDYIFVDQPDVQELIKDYFEDRVVSIGKEKVLTEQEEFKHPSDFIILSRYENRDVNTTNKRKVITSVVPFALEDADCYFFQRFLHLGSQSYDYIEGAASVFDDQGDAKINGYLCDYGSSKVSLDTIENFIRDIKAGKVIIKPHLDELINNAKTNSDE
jgi:hypothetical protein